MKKGLHIISFSTILFIFMLAFAPNMKVDAAGVTQTAATQNSATITWAAPTSSYSVVTAYRVYTKTSDTDYVLYATLNANQTSIQINNLPAGCERSVKVEYDYYSTYNPSKTYNSYIGYTYIRTRPGKVTGLKQDRWYYFILSFTAVWDKQEGVDGYEYIVKTNKNKKSNLSYIYL